MAPQARAYEYKTSDLHGPSRPLRMLHTSDVHLETDLFGPGQRGEAMRLRVRRAFSQVISVANRERMDLVLIVGDLFDSTRVTPEAFDFALGEIARARMPVVMIPGNHDAHDESSIYAGLPAGRLPANLHLILEPDGTVIEFADLQAQIWGRALVEHSPDYRPLSGIVPPRREWWNIALAHGLYTDDSWMERSSPITPREIADSGYHYVALGHVHVFNDCSHGATRAFYCGTPSPIQRGETGAVLEVSCEPSGDVAIRRLVIDPEA